MTDDQDIIIEKGKTCEFVLCYDNAEKGTHKWFLSAFFWGNKRLKAICPICHCISAEVGIKKIKKLISIGH